MRGSLQHQSVERRAEIVALGVSTRARDTSVMARPGNQNAVRRRRLYAIAKGHSHVNERIRTLAHGVIAQLGLDPVLDMPIVRSWAKAEILETETLGFLLKELEKGQLSRSLLGEWRQTTALQLTLAKELGMTPASRIALGLDVQRGRTLMSAAEEIARARVRQGQEALGE